MKTRIAISLKDIAEAKMFHANECPVARAIARRVKPEFKVGVGLTCFTLNGKPKGLEADLPDKAAQFVDRFDNTRSGRTVKPITFQLDIPEQFLK